MSFRMLILGDSIMWGQGLPEGAKATALVAKTIGQKQRVDVTQARYARSGADTWDANETLLQDLSPFPRELPPILAALDEGTIVGSGAVLGTQTARDAIGEVPDTRPFILRQILAARADLQAESVDLVLVNGGINDVAVPNIVLPYKSARLLQKRTRSYAGHMAATLDRIHAAFPAARIVVTGYYPIISAASEIGRILDFSTELVLRAPEPARQEMALDGALASMNTARLAERQRQSLVLRNDARVALRTARAARADAELDELAPAAPELDDVAPVDVLAPMKAHLIDLSRTFADTLSMGPKMRADLVKIADRPQISSPSETTPSSRRSPGRAADAATGG